MTDPLGTVEIGRPSTIWTALPEAVQPLPGSGPVDASNTRFYPSELRGSGVDTPTGKGGDSLAHPVNLAAGTDTTVLGLPTWLVALGIAALLLSMLLGGRGGKGKKRGSSRAGRGGRVFGLPALLVVGLLIGATAFGGNTVRSIVQAIVHAVTTFGGLFGS